VKGLRFYTVIFWPFGAFSASKKSLWLNGRWAFANGLFWGLLAGENLPFRFAGKGEKLPHWVITYHRMKPEPGFEDKGKY